MAMKNGSMALEADGKVVAWQRAFGPTSCGHKTALRFRGLTAPLVMGAIAGAGGSGRLASFIFCRNQDGKAIQRVSTDGSAITGKPVAVGNGGFGGGDTHRRCYRLSARMIDRNIFK